MQIKFIGLVLVRYGIKTVVCAGWTILMTPAHMQISVAMASSAGIDPISTVGAPPGIHGAVVAGTHGMGVKTPSAAAVAAITAGFEGL